MRAISLHQPWASLWALGRKRFETRHWQAKHRGALVIHAAQHLEVNIADDLEAICRDQFGNTWARALPRGALLGTCNLLNCIPTADMHVGPEERAQGNFTPGRFAWESDDRKLLPRPIPFRGRQSIFQVPDDLIVAAFAETA
jgi:hypothetical protein